MKRTRLWIVAAVLLAGSIFVLFFYSPGARSDLAAKGKRGYGQVQSKFSQPGPNGETVYVVTFIYQDEEQKKNHMVTRQMYDVGRWSDLKEGQDVHVTYLPSDPDREASIEGAEGLASPKPAALVFLAWSALVAGLVVAAMAWNAPKPGRGPAPPGGRGPVVTQR